MSLHEIEIEYGERYTDFVMGMYVDTSMADDIDELGWNLCDCDDAVFQEKIGHCLIVTTKSLNGVLKTLFEFSGNDDSKKEEVIEEILDSWNDLALHSMKGLLSRV